MGWLIALALLVALAFLPLGVRSCYGESGPDVRLLVGPLAIPIGAGKKKKRKQKEKKTSSGAETASKGGSLTDFLPLARLAWAFLQELRLRLRVPVLEFRLVLGSGDPCDLGVTYGRACTALAAIEPQLDRFLIIRKKDLRVECDFTAEQSIVTARADVTITLGRLLTLILRYGTRVYSAYNKILKSQKGGANQ